LLLRSYTGIVGLDIFLLQQRLFTPALCDGKYFSYSAVRLLFANFLYFFQRNVPGFAHWLVERHRWKFIILKWRLFIEDVAGDETL